MIKQRNTNCFFLNKLARALPRQFNIRYQEYLWISFNSLIKFIEVVMQYLNNIFKIQINQRNKTKTQEKRKKKKLIKCFKSNQCHSHEIVIVENNVFHGPKLYSQFQLYKDSTDVVIKIYFELRSGQKLMKIINIRKLLKIGLKMYHQKIFTKQRWNRK